MGSLLITKRSANAGLMPIKLNG